MRRGQAQRWGWGLVMLSLAVGCALPKPTSSLPARPVAIKAAPPSQNLGTIAGTVQGPAAGLIANNGAGVLANNGGGLIANNSAGFHLLSADGSLEPVVDGHVEVIDAESGQAVAAPVTTGPDGRYTVGGLEASGPLLFVRVTYEREGHPVTLLGAVSAAREAGEVEVPINPASTLMAKKLREALNSGSLQASAIKPAALEEAVRQLAAAMSERAIVAAAILDDARASAAFDAMLAESEALRETVAPAIREAGAIALVPSPPDRTPTPAPSAAAEATPAPTATPTATPTPPKPWTVSTVAGDGVAGSRDGTGAAARFQRPEGMTLAANGDLYVADAGNEQIRLVAAGGEVTTPTPDDEVGPSDLAFDADGNLFAVEAVYHHVHRTTPELTDSLFAGGGAGLEDGQGTSALFKSPRGVTVDAAGIVYVADTGNDRIRLITQDGEVTTLAVTDLSEPVDLVVAPDGTLYVTESGHGRISRITPAGARSTLVDGLLSPTGLAMDRHGHLYVAESGRHRICKVDPTGALTVLAGDGSPGFADGEGPAARFSTPTGVAVDADGTTIYVGDRGNHRIRVLRN